MNFLIINDDGKESKSLLKLLEVLDGDFGYCYVAIPKNQRSATSNAVTIKNFINFEEINPLAHSEKTIIVDGFPADCLRVALNHFENIKFDIVFSGINQGENLGYDILYSGTIGACREASILNIPAIALSGPEYFTENYTDDLKKVIHFLFENKIYEKAKILNINIPEKNKGIKFVSQGKRNYIPTLKLINENNFEINFSLSQPNENNMTDGISYRDGFTTICPLTLDQTDYQTLRELNKIKK